jgi:TatD DNase family protein
VNPIPYIDIHTHLVHSEKLTVSVRNIYPGEGIPAFLGRNFFSAGLHPWHIGSRETNNQKLQMLEDALEFDHVIFVGECGLDKAVNNNFDEQLRVFKAQVFMAEEYQKPLMVHCVKAYNEVIEMHNSVHPSVPWIFHGYSANPEITRQLLKKNIFFSFGEILFKENAKAVESFRILPQSVIFLETDEFEGGIRSIYKQGASLKEVPEDVLKASVWDNFNRIENVRFQYS